MSARLEADVQNAGAAGLPLLPAGGTLAPAPVVFDTDERWGGHALPSDHPQWMKDTLSISQRARALIVKLKPVVLKVIGYWEHRVHSIVIGGRRLSVDASGSYRMD